MGLFFIGFHIILLFFIGELYLTVFDIDVLVNDRAIFALLLIPLLLFYIFILAKLFNPLSDV